MTVEERVKKVIAETLSVDPKKITLESSLTHDLGADSLDTVEVVINLEDEFEIEIPDENVQGEAAVGQVIVGSGTVRGGLVIVKDIISYIDKKTK